MKNIGIYVHIPFCKSKCFYCDFLSFAPSAASTILPGDVETYVNALTDEIKIFDADGYKIETIFIGGGTPSYIPPLFLRKIFDALRKFNIAGDAEITVEANPGTLDTKKLKMMKSCGVNRLSIGAQTTDDKILKSIGRGHTAADFFESFECARAAGFDNINVDIMFSLPGQTKEILRDTCEKIVKLKPEHISAYALTVEENTPMHQMIADKKISLPDDQSDREMYHFIIKFLTDNGYKHYEISNFAKDGFSCRHNVSCWERGEYVGFGLGAHSFLNGKRFNNTKNFLRYINNSSDKAAITEDIIDIDEADAIEETMFLGLRMTRGVPFTETIRKIYKNQIDKLISSGLLKIERDRLMLTDRGLDCANIVFSEFIGVSLTR